MEGKWLSVREAAEHLGLGATAIRELTSAGKLAHYRVGPKQGRLKFKASDLDAYVEGSRRGPKQELARVARKQPVPKYDHGF